MTEDEKEFEEMWKVEEMEHGEKFTFYPIIKRLARRYWLEGRRTLREKMKRDGSEDVREHPNPLCRP